MKFGVCIPHYGRPIDAGGLTEMAIKAEEMGFDSVWVTDHIIVPHSDPEILGGTPLFTGTRVPAQSLFDYLEGGETLDEFLRQFPSVKREQALAALEIACDSVISIARST